MEPSFLKLVFPVTLMEPSFLELVCFPSLFSQLLRTRPLPALQALQTALLTQLQEELSARPLLALRIMALLTISAKESRLPLCFFEQTAQLKQEFLQFYQKSSPKNRDLQLYNILHQHSKLKDPTTFSQTTDSLIKHANLLEDYREEGAALVLRHLFASKQLQRAVFLRPLSPRNQAFLSKLQALRQIKAEPAMIAEEPEEQLSSNLEDVLCRLRQILMTYPKDSKAVDTAVKSLRGIARTQRDRTSLMVLILACKVIKGSSSLTLVDQLSAIFSIGAPSPRALIALVASCFILCERENKAGIYEELFQKHEGERDKQAHALALLLDLPSRDSANPLALGLVFNELVENPELVRLVNSRRHTQVLLRVLLSQIEPFVSWSGVKLNSHQLLAEIELQKYYQCERDRREEVLRVLAQLELKLEDEAYFAKYVRACVTGQLAELLFALLEEQTRGKNFLLSRAKLPFEVLYRVFLAKGQVQPAIVVSQFCQSLAFGLKLQSVERPDVWFSLDLVRAYLPQLQGESQTRLDRRVREPGFYSNEVQLGGRKGEAVQYLLECLVAPQ